MQTSYAVAPAGRIGNSSTAKARIGSGAVRIRVLHIEDNPEQAELVKLYLLGDDDEHYSIEWIPSILEGMRRLSKPGIDVVLLDLGMPELVGHRTHTAIRASAPTSPIVILTCDERVISKDLALLCGAAGYLVKNDTSPDDLKQAIRQAYFYHRHR